VVAGEEMTEPPGSAVRVRPSPAWRVIGSFRRASSSTPPVNHARHTIRPLLMIAGTEAARPSPGVPIKVQMAHLRDLREAQNDISAG
jgi:hypothetical protein